MTSKEFVKHVYEAQRQNWANSDIPTPVQIALEKIADHFSWCNDCSIDFDSMNYQEKTLIDIFIRFSDRLSIQNLGDWICNSKLYEIWIDNILYDQAVWNPKLKNTNFGPSSPMELMADYLEDEIYSRWLQEAKRNGDSWYAVIDGTPLEVRKRS